MNKEKVAMSNKTNKYSLDEIPVRLKNEDASKLLTDESIDNPAIAVKDRKSVV